MPRRQLEIAFDEIKGIRWCCPKCQSIIDYSLEKEIENKPNFHGGFVECPICGADFHQNSDESMSLVMTKNIRDLIRSINSYGKYFSFIVQDEPPPPPPIK